MNELYTACLCNDSCLYSLPCTFGAHPAPRYFASPSPSSVLGRPPSVQSTHSFPSSVSRCHCLHNPLPSACRKRGSWRSGVLPQRCAPGHPCPQVLAGLLVRRAHACRPGWEGGQTGWTLGSGLPGEEGGASEPRPRAPPPGAPPTAGIKKRLTSLLRQTFLPAPRAGHLLPSPNTPG